jgi:hypothetical protein
MASSSTPLSPQERPPPHQLSADGRAPAATSQRLSGWAIASLAFALAGLLGLVLIGQVLGLVFGYVALDQIRQSDGVVGGKKLAQAGVIMGWIGIALSLLVGLTLLLVAGYFAAADYLM